MSGVKDIEAPGTTDDREAAAAAATDDRGPAAPADPPPAQPIEAPGVDPAAAQAVEAPGADPAAAEPLFSLVMCVYNVEKYVADAVRSALAQRCGDFELLLVDDGSPDASIARALDAAQGDPRVRVVRHEANQGLSAARNTGLAHARGRYVGFPDPDDLLGDRYLSSAAEAVRETGADIVVEGTCERYFDAQGALAYENPIVPAPFVCRTPEELAHAVLPLEEATLLGYVNNKFFRRGVVGETRFDPSITVSEDFFFTLSVVEKAASLAVVPVAEYRYAKRATGLTGARYNARRYAPEYYQIHHRRVERLLGYLEARGVADDAALATVGALYGRYVVSTLMRQAAPEGGLSLSQRSAWVRQLQNDPLFRRLIPVARARDSRALSLSLAVLRSGVVPLALALGSAVGWAKAQGPGLATRLQSQR